jgi:cadmium resistance protein CadD (predicted permease)
MIDLLIPILVAISAFIATNIDDIFLLMVFFAHPDYKSSSVIIGQYVGIICLILICIPAYLLKSFIPPFWLALMGLIPVFLGLKQLKDMRRNKINSSSSLSEPDVSFEKSDYAKSNHEKSDENKKSKHNNDKHNKLAWISVAIITITNGADNIGVYVPLFTNLSLLELILTIFVFLIMTGIWCLTGRYVIKNMRLGNRISQYGHIILPFVLIILGIVIFISNILKM